MAATVLIPASLIAHTAGGLQVVAQGTTVAELIAELDRQHPGIGARLVHRGVLRRSVAVFVGAEDVRSLAGLDTPVEDGAEVTIVPAIAGG